MKNIIQFPKPKEIDELFIETLTPYQFDLFGKLLEKLKEEQIKEQEELISTLYTLTSDNKKLRYENFKLKRELNQWKKRILTTKKK